MKIIIGVVGQIACGKGVLVKYLIKKLGFTSFSLSSLLHEELKKQNIKNYTRKELQDLGDDWRKKYGDGVLAKKAIKKLRVEGRNSKLDIEVRRSKFDNLTSNIQFQNQASIIHSPPSIIIEGIRNTGEIEYLKTLTNFVLIGIKAKREIRYKRLLQRAKPWDPKNWNDFMVVDRRDLGVGQKKSGQQVGKCLAYCDYVLINNKDKTDFQRKVKKLVDKILV
jgi:dephospho-CoA kinase